MCLEINYNLHQLLRIPIPTLGNHEEDIELHGNTRYYKPIIAEKDLKVYKLLKKPIFGITETPHMKKVLWFWELRCDPSIGFWEALEHAKESGEL